MFRQLVPKKIDFYVLGEIIGPFLGGILFFSFVFLMFQALRLADFFIIHGVSGPLLGKMVMLLILSFLPTALPIAFLIGVLVGFGRLSADSELVAMKAHGISLGRLSIPLTLLGLLVVGISLGLNLDWVPKGELEFKNLLIRVNNSKVVASIKEGTFTSGFFDLLIYADHVDTNTNRLYKVFIYDEREPKSPLTVVAKEGEIASVKTESEFSAAAVLKLYDGNIHRNDLSAQTYQKIDFDEYRLYLKVDDAGGEAAVKPRMIPYRNLKQRIADSPPGSAPYREFTSELWRRYSIALSPLIFVFLGMGFGTTRTRSVRAGAALIAFIVVVIYWSLQALAAVIVQRGYAHPILAMQLPNAVIASLAIYGFKSANW